VGAQLANLGAIRSTTVVVMSIRGYEQIELPAAGHVVEHHEPFLVQRLEELCDEEGVAHGLR